MKIIIVLFIELLRKVDNQQKKGVITTGSNGNFDCLFQLEEDTFFAPLISILTYITENQFFLLYILLKGLLFESNFDNENYNLMFKIQNFFGTEKSYLY
jgi:hypothetical protein